MLKYLTRDGALPNGKPWVCLCAMPEESPALLPGISKDIFQFCNCAIWYDDGVDTDPRELADAVALSGMAVLPVTAGLLDPECALRRVMLPLLQTHRVSILPVLDDPNLLDAFNAQFRNMQILDRHSDDRTAIPYAEKLERFLDAMLIRDDLAERVRQAFRGQIFLSYRKKDRSLALTLMKQLHRDPRFRDIAVWYDEFLTPGEDFNENIAQAIRSSDLFLLALTCSMVGEPNYVIETEYPCARDSGKAILPVELEPVDPSLVQQNFPGLPASVSISEAPERLTQLMGTPPQKTPEQDYLLGLAYLHGLHLERSPALGLALLEQSVQRGHAPAALHLACIQHLEDTPEERAERQRKWLGKYAALTSENYRQSPNRETAREYAGALDRLADTVFQQRTGASFILYQQAINLLHKYELIEECAQVCSNYGLRLIDGGRNQDGLQVLLQALQFYSTLHQTDPEWGKTHPETFSYCYYNTGNAALHAGEFAMAEQAYNAAIRSFSILAKKEPEEYTLVLAQANGNLASTYRQLWIKTGLQSYYLQAERHHSRAAEILRAMIPAAPEVYEPSYGQEMASAAALHIQGKEYDKAKQELDMAISIFQVYESRYPGQYLENLATALGNRAGLYFALDQMEAARTDFQTVIDIFRTLPNREPELGRTLWSLGNTYAKERKFNLARPCYEQAVACYESGTVQGADCCPDFALCCQFYGNMLYQSGAPREALHWIRRALDIYRRLQGGDPSAYASQIEGLMEFANYLSRFS